MTTVVDIFPSFTIRHFIHSYTIACHKCGGLEVLAYDAAEVVAIMDEHAAGHRLMAGTKRQVHHLEEALSRLLDLVDTSDASRCSISPECKALIRPYVETWIQYPLDNLLTDLKGQPT